MALTRVFAHRGSAQSAPENSISAFLEARRLGADGVELDVRRSADGALVVHHDSAVEGIGEIATLAVADLPNEIPLFDAALEACASMTVNIEIKNDPGEAGHDPTDGLAIDVVAHVVELDRRSEVIISSFDRATLDAVRRADAEIAIGLLLGFGVDPIDVLEGLVASGFNAVHPFVLLVSAPLVEAAHTAGLAVNTWTVDAAHDLEAMARLGVDAVITDDVPLALAVIDQVQQGLE